MKSLRSLFICMCAIVMSAGMAEATAKLALTRVGNGIYTVNLTDIVDPWMIIHFTITYDTATLENPVMELANGLSGVNLDFNDRTRGELLVNFTTTGTKFNGQVATLKFNPKGATAGKVHIIPGFFSTLTNSTEQMQFVIDPTPTNTSGISTSKADINVTNETRTSGSFKVTFKTYGNGTISCNPTLVTSGQKTNCTVIPNAGYRVANIIGCGGSLGHLSGTTYTTGAVNKDCEVTANFSLGSTDQVMQPVKTFTGTPTVSTAGFDAGQAPPVPPPTHEATPATVPAPEAEVLPSLTNDAPVAAVPQETAPAQVDDKGPNSKKIETKPKTGEIDKFRTIPNVLYNFRTFSGVRKLSTYQPLFLNNLQNKDLSQDPPIAISDGKTPIGLTIEIESSIVNPNFAMIGASIKSVRKKGAQTWQVAAMPVKGAYDVRIIISNGAKNIEVPLIVVPALDPVIIKRTKKLSEEGVQTLLSREDPAAGKPAYDLNGDGIRNYSDDYILVAHYLRKKMEGSAKK